MKNFGSRGEQWQHAPREPAVPSSHTPTHSKRNKAIGNSTRPIRASKSWTDEKDVGEREPHLKSGGNLKRGVSEAWLKGPMTPE